MIFDKFTSKWYHHYMRLACLLFVSMTCIAGETDLIKEIGEDDYEVREIASKQLALLGEDKLQWLIDQHMKNLKNPEVSTRLAVAAKSVFCRTVLLRTAEYRSFRAWMGVRTQSTYERVEKPDENARAQVVLPDGFDSRITGMERVREVLPGSPAEGILQEDDLIEYIWKDEEQGWAKPPIKYGLLSGEVLKFQVRRYTEKDKAFSDAYIDMANKDYKLITIEIKVGWSPRPVQEEDEAIASRQWMIFLAKASTPKE